MPEGLVLQASLPCPLVQLEGFSTKAGSFLFQTISYIKEKVSNYLRKAEKRSYLNQIVKETEKNTN